jgi:hypothetical protein
MSRPASRRDLRDESGLDRCGGCGRWQLVDELCGVCARASLDCLVPDGCPDPDTGMPCNTCWLTGRARSTTDV